MRALEHLRDGSRVGDEGRGRKLANGGHGAERGERAVGDPGDERVRVLVLELVDRVLNVAHRQLAAERDRDGEVLAHSGVDSREQAAALEEGRREVGDVGRSVRAVRRRHKRRVAGSEKVQTGEGDHVDGQLAEVRVEDTRETERRGEPSHDLCNQLVEVLVLGRLLLEVVDADLVQSFVLESVGSATHPRRCSR